MDNAFEAEAKVVDINIRADSDDPSLKVITVSDDGRGMNPSVLRTALQFGGSTRFGKRMGIGRFGMGLPNCSVSQARRLDVYTWTRPERIWWSYLDVDEIREGNLRGVPFPVRRKLPSELSVRTSGSGTVVIWRKCDRLSVKRESALVIRLKRELGRIFRRLLWDGRKLRLNGETILPVDPLFLRDGNNLTGATMYGPQLEYSLRDENGRRFPTRKVIARFVELPVKDWVSLSNTQKQHHGISKDAGISILRAGREIDFGWYFMGGKRKENYDDWWRCELEFPPELDELFGVTHTKQGITPSEYISHLLTPDFESIAHELNRRARSAFLKVKVERALPSERRAFECDKLFEPAVITLRKPGPRTGNQNGVRFHYKLATERLDTREFYIAQVKPSVMRLVLNGQHPFYERFYRPLAASKKRQPQVITRGLELLLFAAARAEATTRSSRDRAAVARFRQKWSDLVAAFFA